VLFGDSRRLLPGSRGSAEPGHRCQSGVHLRSHVAPPHTKPGVWHVILSAPHCVVLSLACSGSPGSCRSGSSRTRAGRTTFRWTASYHIYLIGIKRTNRAGLSIKEFQERFWGVVYGLAQQNLAAHPAGHGRFRPAAAGLLGRDATVQHPRRSGPAALIAARGLRRSSDFPGPAGAIPASRCWSRRLKRWSAPNPGATSRLALSPLPHSPRPMRGLAVRTVAIQHHRRRCACERPIVAHVAPQPPGPRPPQGRAWSCRGRGRAPASWCRRPDACGAPESHAPGG
jgi:hypothetical protein